MFLFQPPKSAKKKLSKADKEKLKKEEAERKAQEEGLHRPEPSLSLFICSTESFFCNSILPCIYEPYMACHPEGL